MYWPRVARTADVAVVAVLAVSAQRAVWIADGGPLAEDRAVHAVLLAVATVPLFGRRSRPLPVLLLVLGSAWLQSELGGQAWQPWFAVLMALYAVGAHAERRAALLGAAVTAAALLAFDVPRLVAGEPIEDVVPAWFVLAGTWGLGRWVRHRGQETERLHARAAVAEREGAGQAAQAVADERARIARELHDLVAHSMGVIVIQAQAGARAVAADPEVARSALVSIETAGRQGMAELRRLLGLLTGPEDSSVTPQPGLRDLGALVDGVRAAGLPVELDLAGEIDGLPAGIDLAAYRIVQQALTNVLEHAGPANARVRVRVCGGAVDVEVRDDGRGAGDPAGGPGRGRGLVGMRERAALYGGTLDAGPLPGGGFQVRARLVGEGRPA